MERRSKEQLHLETELPANIHGQQQLETSPGVQPGGTAALANYQAANQFSTLINFPCVSVMLKEQAYGKPFEHVIILLDIKMCRHLISSF